MIDVSVVVPVYGVEKYIERCVRSLFEQTLTDGVEFIFVDDCTQDDSINVLQRVLAEYPQLEGQVTILHHEKNLGLPSARKTGIMAAKGEYIYNVDSDDWLELNAIELLLTEARKTGADIVVADVYYDLNGNKRLLHQPVNPSTYLEDMVQANNIWAVWNKLFHRSLYFDPKPIVFPISHMGEDMVQVYQLTQRAHKISYAPTPVYNYRSPISNAKSGTFDINKRFFNLMSQNVELLIRETNLSSKPHEADWLRMQAKSMLYPVTVPEHSLREYLKAYPKLNCSILFNRVAPFRAKVKHIAIVVGLSSLIAAIKRWRAH